MCSPPLSGASLRRWRGLPAEASLDPTLVSVFRRELAAVVDAIRRYLEASRENHQALTTWIARFWGLVTNWLRVRAAMGGWPGRRSKITSQPLSRPSPAR